MEPRATAFGGAVTVLYVGGEKNLFEAHFELADAYEKDADALMRGFVDLVRKLPPSVRKLWNSARSRDFNVGIQSAPQPLCHELRLTAKTLEAVAAVRGSVVITTYAPAPEISEATLKSLQKQRPVKK